MKADDRLCAALLHLKYIVGSATLVHSHWAESHFVFQLEAVRPSSESEEVWHHMVSSIGAVMKLAFANPAPARELFDEEAV
jgi:hypothetical protein